MMTNAGRTRSYGVEATVDWWPVKNLDLRAAYGYTNARFLKYNDGNNDYRGRYVPYAPQHTLSLSGDYTWHVNRTLQRVRLHADWRGVGRIYWNEANTLSQPFYGLLGASVALDFNRWTLEMWGRNLTGEEYDTFYFVSVGNAFMQSGRPRQLGVKLSFEF
jgi:outer membrane receptor protein involved in Fe transport